MRRTAWATASILSVALLVAGCSDSDSDGAIGGDSSFPGVVTSAASWPNDRGLVRVGIGDDRHLPPPYLTITASSLVTAQCHGPQGQPPRAVTVTTTDGWKIELAHGSQTITAENPSIEFPAGQLTTTQSSIDYDEDSNAAQLERLGHTTIYTSGVNWDLPAPGHIEVNININEDDLPPEWGQSPEFKMNMHVNCGGDPAALPSSTTNRPPG